MSPYPIGGSSIKEISRILQSFQDPLEVPKTTRQYHKWTSIFGSVRFSSAFNADKGIAVQQWLRDEYRNAFRPTTRRWGVVQCKESTGRSSTSPVFIYRDSSRSLIHDDSSPLPSRGRILILANGIEGLTTNLQSLVTMERELYRLAVHLGFRMRSSPDEPHVGQDRIGGIGWTFYSLSTLVNMLLGHEKIDPKHERLIHSWFIIHGCKVQ